MLYRRIYSVSVPGLFSNYRIKMTVTASSVMRDAVCCFDKDNHSTIPSHHHHHHSQVSSSSNHSSTQNHQSTASCTSAPASTKITHQHTISNALDTDVVVDDYIIGLHHQHHYQRNHRQSHHRHHHHQYKKNTSVIILKNANAKTHNIDDKDNNNNFHHHSTHPHHENHLSIPTSTDTGTGTDTSPSSSSGAYTNESINSTPDKFNKNNDDFSIIRLQDQFQDHGKFYKTMDQDEGTSFELYHRQKRERKEYTPSIQSPSKDTGTSTGTSTGTVPIATDITPV